MSKNGKTHIEFENTGDGETYAIAANGSVHQLVDGKPYKKVVMTGAQLDRVVEGAKYFHSLTPPKLETRTGEYDITYYTDEDQYERGDISVGCVHVPFEILLKAQRLSRKLRART